MSGLVRKISIAVIDIFGKKRGIPINRVVRDFTHGEMTSSILTSLTKDLHPQITKIPVKVRPNSKNMSFELKSLLKQLKKINKNGKDFDYINISGSFPTEYALFGLSEGGAELANPKVIERILSEMSQVNYINGQAQRIVPGQVTHIIEELERITSKGTKVYISACNKRNCFNPFSLANGVHTIGGCDGVTKLPIKRFANYPLVESHVNLPIYVTESKAIMNDPTKTALSLKDLIPINSNFSKFSRKQLTQKMATKEDYIRLQHYVDELYATGKFKFDIDFFRFKLASTVDSSLKHKLWDLRKFQEIFAGKMDGEVLRYTTPAGTHCDLMFRQFFDMKSRTNYLIPMSQTTKIPNTLSGTSFAAPQGLNNAIREDMGRSLNFLS